MAAFTQAFADQVLASIAPPDFSRPVFCRLITARSVSVRITDIAAAKVETAIEELQVPQVVKDSITWEVVPLVSPAAFRFALVVCVPVPGSADKVLQLDAREAFDAFEDQSRINDLVRNQVHEAQARADQVASQARAQANGHKSPGGLFLTP